MRKLRAAMVRTMPLMITCRELEDFIVDYLEDTLPRRQRMIFNLHLRMCRDCRSYLEAYKRVTALGKVAFNEPDELVSNDVPEDLVKAIRAAREKDA